MANNWQFQQLTVKSLLLSRLQSAIDLSSCTILNKPFMNRQDACSTKKFTLGGTGILPVADIGGTGILPVADIGGTGILPVAD
ncbi:MAG: hypothetical protein EAZ09_23720, partial [Oscillatoriales cyanobacterium]